MKVALLTHLPIHISEPGAHPQKPPVHVSENEHRLPHRPQLLESLIKPAVSTQLPLQYAWPAGQSKGDVLVPVGDGCGRLAIACGGRPFDRVIAAATRSRSSDSGCCSTISAGDPTSRKKLWEFANITSEATPPTAKPTMAPMAVLFRPPGLNVTPTLFDSLGATRFQFMKSRPFQSVAEVPLVYWQDVAHGGRGHDHNR